MTIHKVIALLIALSLFLPVAASAQSAPEQSQNTEEIQALLDQIQALLAIIETLQAQLAAMEAGEIPRQIGITKDFGVGDEDIEVRTLQEILNLDPRTQVAESGAGSPGQESMYYGSRTADAVRRFQELYADEILRPVGLRSGTGYFGPSTRAKLNEIIAARFGSTVAQTESITQGTDQDNTNDITPPSTQNNTSGGSALGSGSSAASNTIVGSVESGSVGQLGLGLLDVAYETYDGFAVGAASSYAGAPGERITLQGNKLTNGTRIHFGETTVTGNATADGKVLVFTVPDIKKGPYELTFTSASGEEALRVMDFVITFENATAPEIFTIRPALGPNGTEVTIRGKGFTATDNQVEFGTNVVSGVSSPDGKTITLAVDPGIEIPTDASSEGVVSAEWPVLIYISNANGRIEEPATFIIKN